MRKRLCAGATPRRAVVLHMELYSERRRASRTSHAVFNEEGDFPLPSPPSAPGLHSATRRRKWGPFRGRTTTPHLSMGLPSSLELGWELFTTPFCVDREVTRHFNEDSVLFNESEAAGDPKVVKERNVRKYSI